jgi:uncharacterized protein
MTVVRRKKQRHRSGLAPAPEVRFRSTSLEVRSAADGSDTIEILGQPIVYDTPYKVRDMFGEFEETMVSGACAAVLTRGVDCRFLFNHDGMPLARTTSGTMTLTDTPTQVDLVARLDARQQLANDLAVAIERQDVSRMSVAFVNGHDVWDTTMTQRAIDVVDDLLDSSAVTYPASPTTSIDVAQRMMLSVGPESRARVRKLYAVTRGLKEGRGMTAENAEMLAAALESLHQADDADIPGTVASLRELDEDPETTEGPGITDPPEPDPTMPASRHGAPATADERREASLSFGDTKGLVYAALCAYLGEESSVIDVWICDIAADWVVYESWCECEPWLLTCQLAYALDDTTVTFSGEPIEVTPITTYQPVTPPVVEEKSSRSLELELEMLELRRLRAA